MPTHREPGELLLGRYRVQRLLGTGAHGRVYLAGDLARGGSRVALKLVATANGATSANPAESVLRWFRHPAWAAVYDAGPAGEATRFQVTRFIPGASLDTLQGRQPVSQVWHLLEDMARVLRALHGQGLIHYDVTPGNVLRRDEHGRTSFVLTDGGLAHVGPVRNVARGTPQYMAPELTAEGEHDHRVDLYSLGLLAFRLLTGRDPFEGGAGEVLKARRRYDAPRASRDVPSIPHALDDIVAALLSRDPNKRPFDASALLERVRDARSRPLPHFTEAEAVEAATGGPLVGRHGALERFARMARTLAQGVPTHTGATRHPGPVLNAPVLLVRGEPGCGATHVVETLLAGAREEGLPAMLLAGRERAADRRGPLRRLVDGLLTIGRAPGDEVGHARLDLRRGKALHREERRHGHGRALEMFLKTIEETAARTPFVLIVEDYADLPEFARDAVNLLSRHLLSRAEHGGREAQPAVGLLVDLGAAAPDDLLVPDLATPDAPLLTLDALGNDDLEAICQSRFGGLTLLEPDKDHLARRTEGRPAILAGLLSEAARRGDLFYESDRWHWKLERLDDYPINRAVSPQHVEALAALSADERRVLEQLAQTDVSLSASVVDTLCERAGLIGAPDTPLLSLQAHAEHTTFALANLGVRRALRDDLAPEAREERARSLLSALELGATEHTALERADLLLTIGDGASALGLLRVASTDLSADRPRRMQALATRLMDTYDPALATAAGREVLADCLGVGAAATLTALALAARLDPALDSMRTARVVTEVLEAAERNTEALQLATVFVTEDAEATIELARLCATAGRVAMRTRALSVAGALVRVGQRAARQHPRSSPGVLRARIRLAILRSALLSLDRRHAAAIRLCEAAEKTASRARLRLARARALNNLATAYATVGRLGESVRAFERSAKLKAALGDVHAAAQTYVNLGRALEQQGAPLKAASVLRRAAATAARHAFHTTSLRALRALGSIYDQQSNARLACATYRRGLTVATAYAQPIQICLLAWDLAPLEAALGHPVRAAHVLRQSRQGLKALGDPGLRWQYAKARALVDIHGGARARAARLLTAAGRLFEPRFPRETAAWTALANQLAGAPAAQTPAGPLPRWRGAGHEHARIARWLLRCARAETNNPGLPRTLAAGLVAGAAPQQGPVRRMTLEAILAFARIRPGPESRRLLRLAAGAARSASEGGLLARLTAAQSTLEPDPGQSARLFSDAVGHLGDCYEGDALGPRTPPAELISTGPAPAGSPSDTMPLRPTLESLQALAHRRARTLDLQHGGDTRLASALRRVLAATARMEAGGSLDDLLSDMTRSTIAITQAERSCVVLVEQSEDLSIRVATSASDQREDISADELSHTVIHRVIMSRKPLLLHDVFDDEELLSRPSITSLSLRSILCVPMIRGDVLLGVMYADNATLAGSFDKNDLEVLKLFAEQAAAALETNRLVTDLQQSMADLKATQERLVKGERLRVIGEMSSGVAHEFNNLLTSILARVQLLNLNYLAPDLRKDLGLIEKACLDAAEVVRRLQTFSKRERQGTFRPLDLSEICHDGVEFLRPLWSTRRRRGRPPIQVRLEADAPQMVRGDPTEMREVLTNLIKNALDALVDGGSIIVRSARADGQVRVTVTDDGPGIPPDVLVRVCDPFFTTKGERGTGLGLCLSQQIVERHGGTLTVHSEFGHGTEILVTLPCDDGAEAGLPLIEHPAVGARGAGVHLLIIDDDEDVRAPLCSYLERAGYEVSSAGSAEEALELAPGAAPELVLSDVGMPGMDGLELCRRLQDDAPGLPVILMSGWASGINPAEARRAGAQALLAKPFAMQQVTELIENLLARTD